MYPKEYIQFLVHFHSDRDYFECHEVLEEYWKKKDPRNKSSIWVGLILLAVSCYHHRRGNFSGAKRTLEKAIQLFELQLDSFPQLGLEHNQLSRLVTERLFDVNEGRQYTSFNLPICDANLLQDCMKCCEQEGLLWGTKSDLMNKSIVHRHKLRDRTSVIEERNEAIKMKRGSN